MLTATPADLTLAAITALVRFATTQFRRAARDRRTARTLLRLPQPSLARSVTITLIVVLASGALAAAFALGTYVAIT